jgi:putative ABC transport system ATP-binding protein
MMPVIKLIDIYKDFPEPSGLLHVLQGVSLIIKQGEIVLLEGPSGSGKTTFLQIAGCLIHPTRGEVAIGNLQLGQAREKDRVMARRQYLGFVFQHFNLVNSLNVFDNIALGLRLKRLPPNNDQISKMLDILGIKTKALKRPQDLSGGEKQRVAIARGLVGHPQLVIADEPSSQLDSASAETVAQLLRRAAKKIKTAVLIATHDPRLRAIADRICQLRDGKLYE